MLRSCFLSSFVKLCSAVSEEKLKMSQPTRGQCGHLVFPIVLKKNKLGRGRWNLASCQVSLNPVQQFQRTSRKCISQSEARAAILFYRTVWKTQTWYRTLRSCFLSSFVEFCSAIFGSWKYLSQPENRVAILFFLPQKNHGGLRGRFDLVYDMTSKVTVTLKVGST